jgi:hypothetical protein
VRLDGTQAVDFKFSGTDAEGRPTAKAVHG